jgi:hypothetical protein
MKFHKAGEAIGVPRTPPRKVAIGETYGSLVVLEAAQHSRHHELRWLCRCTREIDGKACGRTVVRRSSELLRTTATRACRPCAEVVLKEARGRWGRQGLTR